jgi:uncharacterized protein
MEWSILFAGPVGSGKTQAIRTASDIEVVSTEAEATDETALLKANTTVAMDMGVVNLDEGDRIRLLGAPGQSRFDFMWEILLGQSRGLVLLIDHSRASALEDLRYYVEQMRSGPYARMPFVVGVTHMDQSQNADLRPYRELLRQHTQGSPVPVMEVDARDRRDVRLLLLALTSMLEMAVRVPVRGETRPAA